MRQDILIYVHGTPEAILGLDLGAVHEYDHNKRVWLLQHGASMLQPVASAISTQSLTSAYVGTEPLPADKSWLACEWYGKIVANPQLAEELQATLAGWRAEPLPQMDVVVFSPSPASKIEEARLQYRDKLSSEEATFIEVPLEAIQDSLAGWFDDYASEKVGGWVTLLSGAARIDDSRIRLGNLSALGLRRDESPDSLWAVQRSGAVNVTAMGLSKAHLAEHWTEGGRFKLSREQFDLSALEGVDAEYYVAIQIEAPIDPKVVIGPGAVFEQLSPWETQNLAIASEWHETIDAGQIVGVVLPAWCLNKNLSPPSGQPLRLTPLSFIGNSQSQQAVWSDIARRREEY